MNRIETPLRVLIVDADAAFDRDRHSDLAPASRATHPATSVGLRHETGAEASRLHPVRRATDIEIDLVIAELFADARGLGEILRIAAAKLERHRMLGRVETQQPRWLPATASAVTISV